VEEEQGQKEGQGPRALRGLHAHTEGTNRLTLTEGTCEGPAFT